MTVETLEELAESFTLFDDWEGRYNYLIDLGGELKTFDESKKIDNNIVHGCTSRVWLVAETIDGKFSFEADSDSRIVRGLIYLLVIAYQGKTPEEIASYDIEAAFETLELHQHLSPNRRNGFFAMVQRIKGLASRPGTH